MTALINQELAKIEKRESAYGGRSSDPAMDVVREAWKMGQEQKVWNERKNEQMRSLIDMRTQGYNTEFHNPNLDRDIAQYEGWFKSNQGKFDDVTMDYAQITLDNMKQQRKDNQDFDMYEGQIAERRENLLGNLEDIDATGEKLTKDNIDIIRESNQEWIDYTGEFTKRFGDRLSMKGFSHIKGYLEQGSNMNAFLLESAKDDGWIDEKEYTAYKDSWEQLNTTPIAEYLKREEEHDSTVSKRLNERLSGKIDLYQRLDAFIGDPSTGRKPTGTLPIGISGLDPDAGTPMTWDMMEEYFEEDTGAIQKMLMDQRVNEKELLTEWDDTYKKLNIGQSMINPFIKDFYGVKEPPPKKKDDKVTVEPEDISELNVAVDKLNKEKKISQGISSNLKTSVDSLGRYRKDLGLRGVHIPGRKGIKKPVEINEELLASVQAKINEMAKKGKGGVKRAQALQTAWDNYLASLEKFETNKSVEDIEQEIKTLRAGFTGK